MAWGFGDGFQAAHEHVQTTRAVGVAQNIAAGTDPVHCSLVSASQDPSVDPTARQKVAEFAGTMKTNAEKFLQDAGVPQNAPGTKADPLANTISDLSDKAADGNG